MRTFDYVGSILLFKEQIVATGEEVKNKIGELNKDLKHSYYIALKGFK